MKELSKEVISELEVILSEKLHETIKQFEGEFDGFKALDFAIEYLEAWQNCRKHERE
jgi:hypothetical protein